MTSLVTVPAIKAFTHDGTAFEAGDTVTVRPIVAASLAQQGYVSLSLDYRTSAITAEPVKTPRRRRSYRRRDLVAAE